MGVKTGQEDFGEGFGEREMRVLFRCICLESQRTGFSQDDMFNSEDLKRIDKYDENAGGSL
jgi:hypothetical protein